MPVSTVFPQSGTKNLDAGLKELNRAIMLVEENDNETLGWIAANRYRFYWFLVSGIVPRRLFIPALQ
jgi:hypothetical protein